LRGRGTDEGGHLGRIRELLIEVLDLVQQMAIAILDGAGEPVVAAIAIDHQAPWQRGFAEDLLGQAGRVRRNRNKLSRGVANSQV